MKIVVPKNLKPRERLLYLLNFVDGMDNFNLPDERMEIEIDSSELYSTLKDCLGDIENISNETSEFCFECDDIQYRKFYNERGELHRDYNEGPALIVMDLRNRIVEQEFYYYNGMQHNPYGPAAIYLCSEDSEDDDFCEDFQYNCNWYFNDKNYTSEVENYLKENNLESENMTNLQFDVMWMSIL